jgi:hypothetical protein
MIAAEQAVDQRGFSHARHAEQRDRACRLQVRGQGGLGCIRKSADRHHVDVRQALPECRRFSLGIIAQVGLVEDDHRRGSRIPHHREVSFEAARVQILRERGHEEDDVHVGRDDLFVNGPPRSCSRNRASPFEADVND